MAPTRKERFFKRLEKVSTLIGDILAKAQNIAGDAPADKATNDKVAHGIAIDRSDTKFAEDAFHFRKKPKGGYEVTLCFEDISEVSGSHELIDSMLMDGTFIIPGKYKKAKSFQKDEIRPSKAIKFDLDEGHISNIRIEKVDLKIAKRHTYDSAAQEIDGNPKGRLAEFRKAIDLAAKRYFELERGFADEKSSENLNHNLMVMTGYLVAKWAEQNNVELIFSRKEKSKGLITYTTEPGRNRDFREGLHVEYKKPLRHIIAFLNHLIVDAFLTGKKPEISKEQVETIVQTVNHKMAKLRDSAAIKEYLSGHELDIVHGVRYKFESFKLQDMLKESAIYRFAAAHKDMFAKDLAKSVKEQVPYTKEDLYPLIFLSDSRDDVLNGAKAAAKAILRENRQLALEIVQDLPKVFPNMITAVHTNTQREMEDVNNYKKGVRLSLECHPNIVRVKDTKALITAQKRYSSAGEAASLLLSAIVDRKYVLSETVNKNEGPHSTNIVDSSFVNDVIRDRYKGFSTFLENTRYNRSKDGEDIENSSKTRVMSVFRKYRYRISEAVSTDRQGNTSMMLKVIAPEFGRGIRIEIMADKNSLPEQYTHDPEGYVAKLAYDKALSHLQSFAGQIDSAGKGELFRQ